jgi:hypothetical protein
MRRLGPDRTTSLSQPHVKFHKGAKAPLASFDPDAPAQPDTQPNSALNETRSEPKSEVQTAPTVEDPFKKFLDQKAGSSNTVTKSDNAQALPVQPGKDPFKVFLEKQKQNSKDQVVSPFGKN